MLRSESGNAAVYGVTLILLILFLIWLFWGLSPLEAIRAFGGGLSGMSKDEQRKMEGGSDAPHWELLRAAAVARLGPAAQRIARA